MHIRHTVQQRVLNISSQSPFPLEREFFKIMKFRKTAFWYFEQNDFIQITGNSLSLFKVTFDLFYRVNYHCILLHWMHGLHEKTSNSQQNTSNNPLLPDLTELLVITVLWFIGKKWWSAKQNWNLWEDSGSSRARSEKTEELHAFCTRCHR